MADAASHVSFLPPILTFCAAAVIAVPIFRKLGQSAVLGYLAAGIVIGPSILGVIKDPDAIRSTAEIGVGPSAWASGSQACSGARPTLVP